MSRQATLVSILLGLGVACGGEGGGRPTAPTPTTTSVSVTFPAGETIFIGNAVQFSARATLSDGTTIAANNATWGSDAPAVATVSQSGLVTAVAAGEATIFADVNPRGTLLIRVFPNFGGTWSGSEVFAGCEDSGAFRGICNEPEFRIGTVFSHRSTFTQTQASVNAVIDLGGGTTARMTGTITIGGELQLPTAPVLPADPEFNAEVQNWRSRADTPSRMTGTYEALFTVPGVPGSVKLVVQLQNVVKTSATAAGLSSTENTALGQARRRTTSYLEGNR